MLASEFPPFRPHRLLKSAHLQTVLGATFKGNSHADNAIRRIIDLHDGDRLVVHDDQPEVWALGDRIAILIHGLCGSHRSPSVSRVATKLNRQGVRTIRVDMRGAGASAGVSRSHLHGGNYWDANAVIDAIHQMSPTSKMSLVGFSLGGNLVLKTLGIWGVNPHAQIDSAFVISPPIDLIHCSWHLRQHGNRLYESYFVKQLQNQLRDRRKRVNNLVESNMTCFPSRLVHWDDQFTAPCWGYRSAIEYYRDASSAPNLTDVHVPTVLMTAMDDPVVPFEMYDDHQMSNAIKLMATQHGGHLGFFGRGGEDPDRHWLDWRICQWIQSLEPSDVVSTLPKTMEFCDEVECL